jgi:hypothetical protein
MNDRGNRGMDILRFTRFSKPFFPALLLWVGLALFAAGCRPLEAAGAGQAAPSELRLYLADGFISDNFVPLDGGTLADLPGATSRELHLVSAGGDSGIAVEATAGRANPDPQTIWVNMHDLVNGTTRRFHPPVSGLAVGLSADGTRLLWEPFPPRTQVYPPPVDWYVLSTADGAVAGHVYDEDNACFRQNASLSPDGKRLYCLVDPALHDISGPQPVRVVAYEVVGRNLWTADRPAAEVALETRIGQRPMTMTDSMGWELLEPALALSPDGATLAVVHADGDALTLIDARDLTLIRSLDLAAPRTLLDILGLPAAPAHAKGEMSGTLRQAVFSADGRRLYVFSQLLTPPDAPPPAERGLWLVDLDRGRVTAAALEAYQIQWLLPAPDGSLYAFGTSDDFLMPYEIRETSPSRLWRLDGRTLDVLAEREFTGYRAGRLVARQP